MKNRVYKIKDKILVRGNENELTKDEILVKEENDSVVLKERVNGQVKDIVVKGGGEPELININDINLEQSSQQKNIITFSTSLTKEQYDSIADASLNDNIKLLFNGQYVLFVKYGKFAAVNGEQQGATMLLQILQSGEDVNAIYIMTIQIITAT